MRGLMFKGKEIRPGSYGGEGGMQSRIGKVHHHVLSVVQGIISPRSKPIIEEEITMSESPKPCVSLTTNSVFL